MEKNEMIFSTLIECSTNICVAVTMIEMLKQVVQEHDTGWTMEDDIVKRMTELGKEIEEVIQAKFDNKLFECKQEIVKHMKQDFLETSGILKKTEYKA